ncbi:hypothetical protein [Spirosoma sp. 209]|uniref:hypothetical protein n=1 Tax=Spirosoma sp. 209 TaxID=1955701 RepID=UPI00098D6353|nr:hypothetical protein [Spirosoma sp. 209]
MAIIISILALLATFYQLYLQRVHNEKSLKPLAQIDLPDHGKQLAVYIRNHGLGPLIIDQLVFTKEGKQYKVINDCLNLDPRSYMHISVNKTMKRIVLPNAHLVVFETNFDEHEGVAERDYARRQLAGITLQVVFRDIYDNPMTIERDFEWFGRYLLDNSH